MSDQQPTQYPQQPNPSHQPQQPAQYEPQQPVQFEPQQQDQQTSLLNAARDRFSMIGFSCTILIGLWIGLDFLGVAAVRSVLHGGIPMLLVYLVNAIALYVIAMPLSLLAFKRVPALETRTWRMPTAEFFRLFIICVPIMAAGNLIGNLFSMIVSSGSSSNDLVTMLEQSDWWLVLIFVVIIGPIFEEWLFRGQIISRLRRYGEKTAILFSALVFALFHTNFYQFFYAFGLGLILGYVYTRTSQLRYSIAMHMAVNAFGSLLPLAVLGNVDSRLIDGSMTESELMSMMTNGHLNGGMILLTVYMITYLVLLIAGVVLLIQHRGKWEFYTAPEELPKGTVGHIAFSNIGFVVYVVVALLLTIFQMVA